MPETVHVLDATCVITCFFLQERDRWLHTKKMKTLFEAADESGDGYIDAQLVLLENLLVQDAPLKTPAVVKLTAEDREEFCDIMNIPEVRTDIHNLQPTCCQPLCQPIIRPIIVSCIIARTWLAAQELPVQDSKRPSLSWNICGER